MNPYQLRQILDVLDDLESGGYELLLNKTFPLT
jgi:hypothetical protein